jgi:hypothetical protein
VDIGTTITTIKAVANVARTAGQIDLYNDIIGLQQTILELLAVNTTLTDDNARLTRDATSSLDRIRVLEATLAMRDEMAFRNEAYWRIRAGQSDEGPFCPKCLDGDAKTARMTDRGNGFTCCVVCGHCYGRARPIAPIRY